MKTRLLAYEEKQKNKINRCFKIFELISSQGEETKAKMRQHFGQLVRNKNQKHLILNETNIALIRM